MVVHGFGRSSGFWPLAIVNRRKVFGLRTHTVLTLMTLTIVTQVFIALAMLDVWLLRYNRPLRARGGDAKTMVEEFRVYGLPDWFRSLTRILKLGCAACMVAGIWYPLAAFYAATLLVLLMAGAVAMHVKVKDPLYKSAPALFFLLLSGFVAYGNMPSDL